MCTCLAYTLHTIAVNLNVGELFKGFDWSHALWGSPAKIIAQQCGEVLAYSASATNLLHKAAEQLGGRIHQQLGLRVGVIITDETTTIYITRGS